MPLTSLLELLMLDSLMSDNQDDRNKSKRAPNVARTSLRRATKAATSSSEKHVSLLLLFVNHLEVLIDDRDSQKNTSAAADCT